MKFWEIIVFCPLYVDISTESGHHTRQVRHEWHQMHPILPSLAQLLLQFRDQSLDRLLPQLFFKQNGEASIRI